VWFPAPHGLGGLPVARACAVRPSRLVASPVRTARNLYKTAMPVARRSY